MDRSGSWIPAFFAARRPKSRRWRLGKKDRDPETLDERPGTKKSRREAKKRAIQAKRPSGSQKPGRETKIAVRMAKSRTGRKKRRRTPETAARERKKRVGELSTRVL